MKFCQFLNNCTCCHCGKKIKGPGYITSQSLNINWDENNHIIFDRPKMQWEFPRRKFVSQTACEKCVAAIDKRQRKMQRLALKSFYNDPDAIRMLERKIKANKKNPKLIAKIRRALYSISPVMSKWQAKQPKIDIEALKQIPIG